MCARPNLAAVVLRAPLARKLLLASTGVASVAFPAAARAERFSDFRINIDFGGRSAERRPAEPAPCETRQVRVWVPPVYRTVCDRQWVEPVTRTVCEQVWVPARYEEREVVSYHRGCREVRRERVLVGPAHYESRERRVEVTPGHWENVERHELVCEGHYEYRTETVAVDRRDDDHFRRDVGFEVRRSDRRW